MELKKVQKQGRDERTQEYYPTSAKIHSRCRVVFLRSFISALFLYFFQLHPYLISSFTETFSLVSVLFSGFLNQFLIRKKRVIELETNPFHTEDERVENARSNLSHTHTHS